MKQVFNIETNTGTDPEVFVKQAGIPFRSIQSFYHPEQGWLISLDHGLVTCDEKNKTITYHNPDTE